MNTLAWILLATFVNSLIGFIGVITLFVREKLLNKLVYGLIAFSAGALMGGALFHLLVESLENMPAMNAFICTITGFILFFLFEGYFHWHHCKSCTHPYTYLMLIGDSIHNFIDGLVLAAAFVTDVKLGIITALMVLGHEAPQELGLYGVLLHGKYKKVKALWSSFLAQTTVIIGGVVGYFASIQIEPLAKFLVPFAAGGFIYIAASDLVPEMHRLYRGNFKKSVYVVASFLVGIILMYVLKVYLGGI